MGLKYPAWFIDDDEGFVTLQLYDIPNCIADGEDKERAIAYAIELLDECVLPLNYFEQDKPVPLPSAIEAVDPYWEAFERECAVDILDLPEFLTEKILGHNKLCEQ